MLDLTRRDLLRAAATGLTGLGLGAGNPSRAQVPGVRPAAPATGVRVLNPRDRIPVSLIIDDSTCLVNLAYFAIPQFAEVFPDQYKQPWRTLPREIPDAFVRKFAEWCRSRGVKGKYSVVPAPALVGWIDRDLPGWSRRELEASLDVIRTHIVPDWDIHPEMVTHTWVIDTKTGRPYPDRTEKFMENWGWSVGRSADELADYLSYALRILRNVGLPCSGITTPGGFGNRSLEALAQATLESCRDVYRAEIPHYFRHVFTDDRSVAPRVEYASGLDGDDPRCVVSIIGCTGDWFGGWDGLSPGRTDQFLTADGRGGRLAEILRRGEPAVLVCHWPGIYYNGQEIGFRIFQEVVERLHAHYDNLRWMTNSEIARYWAARELTRITRSPEQRLEFQAPFACPDFTVELPAGAGAPAVRLGPGSSEVLTLREVRRDRDLGPMTWHRRGERAVACFDLPKGRSQLVWAS